MGLTSYVVEPSENTLKWKWTVASPGTIPEKSLNVSENDEEELYVCLAMDSSRNWIIKCFNPDRDTVTNNMKFLAVNGKLGWQNVRPQEMALQIEAIYSEDPGKHGKMYVGRHETTGVLGMVVNPNFENWSFYTYECQDNLMKDGYHVLCVE